MKKIVVIGGSRGIGNAIVNALISDNQVINISRNQPAQLHPNLTHFSCDILTDELPTIEAVDSLIYCPGSINLKPISRLKLEEFREDFEINVIGAVKAIQHFLPVLKNGKNPSILLFSTVAAKLGMPFHASVAAAKSAVEGLESYYGKSLQKEISTVIKSLTLESVDEALDINDPVLVAMRASKQDRMKAAAAQKERMKKRVYGKQREKLEDELWMIAQDLKDAYEDRRNIYDDMEAEAGEKGSEWSDDDANRYGEQLNTVDLEIEKLIKLRQEKEIKLAY